MQSPCVYVMPIFEASERRWQLGREGPGWRAGQLHLDHERQRGCMSICGQGHGRAVRRTGFARTAWGAGGSSLTLLQQLRLLKNQTVNIATSSQCFHLPPSQLSNPAHFTHARDASAAKGVEASQPQTRGHQDHTAAWAGGNQKFLGPAREAHSTCLPARLPTSRI